MTELVSSTFSAAPPEVDGRFYVTEIHKTDDGQEFDYTYLCDLAITDPQLVLDARVVIVRDILLKRDNAQQIVAGTKVPLTRFALLSLFTTPERIAIRNAANSDPVVYDFMDLLSQSANVTYVNATHGVGYLSSKGVITSDRATAILGAF